MIKAGCMKRKTIRNIILSLLAVLVLLAGVLFAVGYFYYSKIIRTYLIETVAKESKKLYQVEMVFWENELRQKPFD